jgi:hypothetical protein
VLFFPLMFFARLWSPQMSGTLRRVGEYTKLGAAVRALRYPMTGAWPNAAALAVLAGCTMCTAAAARFFRWD